MTRRELQMIRKIQVENYKSIADVTLDLGRVTVLVGANGSGKSNLLEAIALASAASQSKLDNEFLISRGIRVTESRFMRSAFEAPNAHPSPIRVAIQGGDELEFRCELAADETASYPKWTQNMEVTARQWLAWLASKKLKRDDAQFERFSALVCGRPDLLVVFTSPHSLPGFLIYAPENSALRTFRAEGQILPLGIRGEGLFAHLKGLNSEAHRDRLVKIKEQLTLIDWFENFDIPANLSPGERSIRIQDRFLPDDALFDQRSANEGFLFLLFYLALFISPETPSFFSIDNIDTSLNPKLCIALMQQIVKLAKENDKQAILTTHNPAVLDGLDLNDDEQRLLVVDRNKDGHTRVRRVDPPKVMEGQPPVSLSEAFTHGYIGGLPKNF